MEKQNLLENPPEKVLLMYRAVVDMINEGCDVNTMKVSDITTRAGIGKGTAYEYFSSKEAIITMALCHDMLLKQGEVEKIVDGSGIFSEKIRDICNYEAKLMEKMQTFCTLVRIGTGSYEISESIREEFKKLQEDVGYGQIEDIIDRLMEQGVAEGAIRQQNIYLRRIAFSAQMLAYASYLVAGGNWNTDISDADMQNFIYESMIKSLG